MQSSVTEKHYFIQDAESYINVHNEVITKKIQLKAAAEAESIVYLSIMIQQMFNLFACKVQHQLPFGRFMFSNPRNFIGVFLGAAFAMGVVYIPPFNIAFATSRTLGPIFWLIPIGFGVLILVYASIRVLNLKKWHPKKPNPDIIGLDLTATIHSFERKA